MRRNIAFLTALTLLVGLGTGVFASGSSENSDQKEIVLNWPCIWVGADAKAGVTKELVDAYNAKNAGRIKVVIEEMPDYAVYDRKIVADIAGRNAPDIFTLKWNADTRALYESSILMDFTDELAAGWEKDFTAGSLEEARINGRMKTLPYETAIAPIWYNKKLFKDAGITKFPETFDEMWTAFDKLKKIGVVPASQMTGANNAFTTQMWYSHIMNSIGGPGIWERPLTDPLFAQGAELLKQMLMNGNTTNDAIGAGPAVASGHYMAQRTALFINGPWFIGNIKKNAPEVYELTALASAPAAGTHKGSQVGFILTVFAAADTKDPQKKAAVLDFLKYLTSPEIAKRISLESGSLLTPNFSLGPDDTVDPLQVEFIEQLNNASFLGGRFDTFFPIAVLDEFGPGVDALVAGKITAQEFTKILEDAKN